MYINGGLFYQNDFTTNLAWGADTTNGGATISAPGATTIKLEVQIIKGSTPGTSSLSLDQIVLSGCAPVSTSRVAAPSTQLSGMCGPCCCAPPPHPSTSCRVLLFGV